MVYCEEKKHWAEDEHQESKNTSPSGPVNNGDNNVVNRPSRICRKILVHRGKLLVLLSACLFALWSTLAKVVTVRIHPIQVIAMTTPFATVGSTALCVYRGIKPPKGPWCYLLLFAAGILVASKNISHIWSLLFISIADAVTITQSQVILVGLLGCILLREKLTVLNAVFAVVAVLGVAIIARPTFIFGQNQDPPPNYNPLLGILLSLLTVFTTASFVIIARKLSILGVHPYFISAFNTAVSSVLSTVVCTAIGYWTCPTSHELLLATAIGALYFVAQVMFYVGLTIETAAAASILFTFKIVAGFIWQFIFFLLLPSWTSICGAALVMLACIGTIWQNSQKTQEEDIVNDHALEEQNVTVPGDDGLEVAVASNIGETVL